MSSSIIDVFVSFIKSCFENVSTHELLTAIFETVYITLISTVIAYIVGIPIGVLLYGTAKGNLFENRILNIILGVVVDLLRSIPFIILLVWTQPLAKTLVGTKIGNTAFIFYLTIAAIPFIARMVESSLKEVDYGVIEAANAMGTNKIQMVVKVLIPEAKPSLLTGAAIAFTTILGYTPMTYLVGGGGLGNIAIRWGIYRNDPKIMIISSVLLVLIVEAFQWSFTLIGNKTNRRNKNTR